MVELDDYDMRLIAQADNEGMWDKRRPKSSQTLMREGATFDLFDQNAEARTTYEGIPEPKPRR